MNVKALHGDMTQGGRDGVMISFKDGRVPILVATDVAARGLDISTVTHVINFDVPNSPDIYVHRIGRTGRIGRSGRAITFIEPKQKRDLEAIEAHANTKIAVWEAGAKVEPAPVTEPKPRRHTRKPRDVEPVQPANGAYRSLIAGCRPRRRPVRGRPDRGRAQRRRRRRAHPQRPAARALRAGRGARGGRRPRRRHGQRGQRAASRSRAGLGTLSSGRAFRDVAAPVGW